MEDDEIIEKVIEHLGSFDMKLRPAIQQSQCVPTKGPNRRLGIPAPFFEARATTRKKQDLYLILDKKAKFKLEN